MFSTHLLCLSCLMNLAFILCYQWQEDLHFCLMLKSVQDLSIMLAWGHLAWADLPSPSWDSGTRWKQITDLTGGFFLVILVSLWRGISLSKMEISNQSDFLLIDATCCVGESWETCGTFALCPQERWNEINEKIDKWPMPSCM